MQTTPQPRSFRRLLWVSVFCMYILACLAMNLLPWHGSPDFRYTGSDPGFAVWNFGWPLAQFIYDSRTGLHNGPLVLESIVLQCGVLVFGIAAALFVGCMRRCRRLNWGLQEVAESPTR